MAKETPKPLLAPRPAAEAVSVLTNVTDDPLIEYTSTKPALEAPTASVLPVKDKERPNEAALLVNVLR